MKARVIVLSILVALAQISLHSANGLWVIPNLALIFVVWYAPKYSFLSMTTTIIIMGVILEISSVMPTGLELLGLFLVLLAAKFVIREGRLASKWTFQLALLAVATVLINILGYATLPSGTIAQDLGYVGLRIALELLYNCSILLIVVGLSGKPSQRDLYYRMPGKH
jgi:hypothetical protein